MFLCIVNDGKGKKKNHNKQEGVSKCKYHFDNLTV